ncbi:hypothetical protein JCM10213_002512 [Rhodosporidiobolus nylandii]
MTTMNYLHTYNSDSASRFAERLRGLAEENSRLQLSQSILQGEYALLLSELGESASQDPHLLAKLQAELVTVPMQLPTLLPPVPLPALDIGSFVCGSFDEDLSTAATYDLHLEDASPPFGATDQGAVVTGLPCLDEIPALGWEMPAAALPLPADFTAYPEPAHVPESNCSGGASSFGSPFSSPPTSYSCSPYFSPLEAASALPYLSLDTACSSLSSTTSAWPAGSMSTAPLCYIPPALPSDQLPSPASFDAQLQAILSGSSFAQSPPAVDDVSLARRPSLAGRTKRQCSPTAEDGVRFSPMAQALPERHQRQASVMSTTSSLLASPEVKPLSRQLSATKRTRTQRTFKDDPTLAVLKNTTSIFATKNKLEANESPVTRLFIDDATLDPSSPLGRAVLLNEPYTPTSFRLDCTLGSTYTFYTAARAAFVVSFALSGPTISPAPSANATTRSPKYTFLHFLPGDVVVAPVETIGSIAWWRLQECRSSHAGYPGAGGWTARFDGADEAEKRRPARIFSHFAKCHAKGCDEEGEWSLMQLAKAMKGGK